jgi:hypothetical protein
MDNPSRPLAIPITPLAKNGFLRTDTEPSTAMPLVAWGDGQKMDHPGP